MRSLVFAGLLTVSLLACKGKESSAPVVDPEVARRAAKEQQDLAARRESLLKSRDALNEERRALEQKIVETKASGGDTAELEQKSAALKTEASEKELEYIQSLQSENTALRAQLDSARGQVGDKGAELAQVMGQLQKRDGQIDDLQKKLVAVATQLTELKGDIKQQCSQMGTSIPTIIQTVDSKGSKYAKKDIEPLLSKARGLMSKKGLLPDDLGPLRSLEDEATKGMAEGDYGKAYFAADQLAKNLELLKVDRAFIAAKISRLSARMKGRTLDAATQKQVEDLFREAVEKNGDADFATANKKLNQISSMI